MSPIEGVYREVIEKSEWVAMPALSLGGVESLVCVPSRTSHRLMTPAERQHAGISDGLVRVSVGIEDVDDLLADFDQALPSA